jgi:hypothetical protein
VGAAQRIPLLIQEPAGVACEIEIVTSGVPLPIGALSSNGVVRLLDGSGGSVPLQVRSSATWRDGSAKWLLLDFPCSVSANASQRFSLEFGSTSQPTQAAVKIQVEESADLLWINTGPLKFSINKKRFGIFEEAMLDQNRDGSFEPGEGMVASGLRPSITLAKEFAGLQTVIQGPDEVVVEEPGPLRVVTKVSGWITDGQGTRLLKYLFRIHAYAGSSEVKVYYTAIQLADKIKMLWVKDLSLTLQPKLSHGGGYVFAGEANNHSGMLAEPAVLSQLAESRYTLHAAGREEEGLKASGWVNVTNANGAGLLVGSRFFWQQFPKAISVSDRGIRFGLYPAEAAKPMDMDQGLAKTDEFVIAFHSGLSDSACADRIRKPRSL